LEFKDTQYTAPFVVINKEHYLMPNMSFMHTLEQMEQEIKDITRRIGWWNLKVGTHVMAVKKGMGLKKGEKVQRIYTIVIVSTREERLDLMLTDIEYGKREVIREGFPDWTPEQFVEFFCKSHKCRQDQIINRIEFKKLIRKAQTEFTLGV
jgi:hypothetical protein